jgi:hypothetical protein
MSIFSGLISGSSATIGGNVGIGTSSPAYKLDIIGRMRVRSDGVASAGHWLTDNTGTTDVFTGLLGVSSTDSWGVYSAGSWRLVVKNGGNVGIGTTNPTAIFHVASNAGMYYTNTDFAAGSVGSGVVIGTGATSGNTYGTIYGFQAGNTSYANLVVPGGNVGIGTTSPDTRLHVSAADTNGLLRLARTGTFAGSGILYANSNDMFGVTDGTNYPFLVNQGATTNTLVVSGSNVGIGTTSATNRLQVQGNVSASSYTSSISNAVGYFGTASWAVSASRGISTEKVDVLSGGSTTGLGIYSGSFSGSLTGTSTSASYAITASYALNAGSGGVTINNNTDNYLVTATGTANTLNGESTVTLDGTTFTANTTNFVVNSTNITVGNDTTDVVGIGNNTVYVSSSKVGIGTTSPASLLDIKYKDGSTNLYRATDTGGQYRWRVDQNFEMLLTNGSGTDLVKIGQTENYFNNGNVGIGTTSPIDGAKLDVRSGKIVAGTGGSTGGSVTIQNYYTDGALSLWGSMYSSGGPMMGYGVKSSTTTANSFLSATGINISRGAYIIEGNVHRWYNGAGQTVAIDSAVTMTERMTMNENGNLAVDTDTLYVDAVNNRVGIGSTSPVVSLDVAGSAMRVGSGVSTAEASLSVGEGRSGTGYAYIDLVGDTTYTDYGFRIIRNNSGANTSSEIVHRGTGQFNITTIEAAGLQLATSNTARLNILSGGNVGIRTTSPSYELDVAGNIRASGSAAGIINNSTSPTLYLQDSDHRSAMVHVNSNTFYVLRGDGTNSLSWAQVGGYWPLVIDLENNNATFGGTLSSSGSLSVGTGNISLGGVTFATYDTSYHTIRRRDGGVGIYLGGADQANYYDNQAHYFRDRSSNTTMTVDTTNARVGIGTTSPSYKLDIGVSVAAASTPSTTLRLNNTSDGGHRILFSNSVAATLAAIDADIESSGTGTDDSIIKFWTATNGSMTEKVRIDKSGNVGIGNTAPVAKLYVEGGSANWNETTPGTSNGTIHLDPGVTTDNFGNAITFGASDSSNGETAQAGIYVRSDGTYGTKMYFATTDAYVSGAKTRMYISEGGNVGIGTTSPGEKLEVNGNAKASDFILSSDRRKKTELLTIDSGLNKVLTLSGYTYKPIDGDRRRAGLMAQDVEEILPEAVYTDDEGYKSLSYEQVIPLLVEAIKELNNKVKLLEENSVK